MFGNPYTKKLPEEVKIPDIRKRLFDIGNTKFAYNFTFDNGKSIKISKIINSILYKVKPYYKIFNNKTVEPPIASIQLIFKTEKGNISEPVILDSKAKSSQKDFIQAINKSNNGILCKLDDTTFLLLMEEINNSEQKTVWSFVNQGRVNYKGLTGRLYANGYMDKGEIIPANEYGEVDIGDVAIALDREKLSMLPTIYLGDYDVQKEVYDLLVQIEKIYKGRIEPFLCLGAAILCVFLEEIWNEFTGFPVIYLQGATKQGKSLIQGVIMNIYGYSKKQMSTGNSTDRAIAEKCHCNNCTCICINDYDFYKAQSSHFENNVVHFYEAGIRDKMRNGKEFDLQPINSTAIYSSNYLPCVKEKIFNRLLPLYFPENGIMTKFISNKFTNDIKRSRILSAVQKYSWEKVSKLIEETENFILLLNIFPNKDRESNNVAIAYAGLLLLEVISGGYKLPNQENLLKEYCNWYQSLIEQTTSPIDNFINSLTTLTSKGYLKQNINFKISLVEGRVYLTFDTQECIKQYNAYFNMTGAYTKTINAKNIGLDLKACEYFVDRTTVLYSDKHQASSTILDITDTPNGKHYYCFFTGNENVEFKEKSNANSK